AINNGNGKFTVEKLPARLQLSSVNSIHCIDINNDGNIDIVSGGNQFDFLPQLERLDASCGDILINDGRGSFKWIEPAQTGLKLKGQLRDIAEIHGRNKKYLLFLQNDEYPFLYEVNNLAKTK
ncbi:MAG TPA: CRTAC1 family protein, partial [Chitinophagaceae bacterium]